MVALNRKVQLAFGTAVAILLVVGGVAYRGMVASNEINRLVRHTHEVLENLTEVLFTVERIVSDSRGFVLTGDKTYLETYRANINSLRRQELKIRGLTADNPGQQQRLPALEALADQRVRFAETLSDLRISKGMAAAAELIQGGQGERIMNEFQAVVRQLQDEELELLAQRRAVADSRLGQTKIVLAFGTLLALAITAAAGWSAHRDSARRARAEEALRDSEEKYRLLLQAADPMVVVNQGGLVVLLNMQAEKQFGYSRDELLGQPLTNIVAEGFAAAAMGTPIELTGRRKNGEDFPAEIVVSRLENAGASLVTAAIRDITIRKGAENGLLRKVEELKRSNGELEQFAYIASHDLQEPLRMVASYTQLLSRRYKGKLDSDADEFIAFAVDGANRMQRLIQDLLLYSRVGTAGKELRTTSSEGAFQRALSNLHGAIEDSGALVTRDPLPSVMADEAQLIQLFQNLIANAIKYQTPGVPLVHVSAARNGGKWEFSVRDNGLGIEARYFEKIFGMFQRLHGREEFAGTGIGLAICKKIVERHGGGITVESQPGQGSTFRFALAAGDTPLLKPSEEAICI